MALRLSREGGVDPLIPCHSKKTKLLFGLFTRAMLAKLLFAVVGFFEFSLIQLALHAEHSLANPIDFNRVWVAHHFVHIVRHNLPRYAIFVGKPSARQYFTTVG